MELLGVLDTVYIKICIISGNCERSVRRRAEGAPPRKWSLLCNSARIVCLCLCLSVSLCADCVHTLSLAACSLRCYANAAPGMGRGEGEELHAPQTHSSTETLLFPLRSRTPVYVFVSTAYRASFCSNFGTVCPFDKLFSPT